MGVDGGILVGMVELVEVAVTMAMTKMMMAMAMAMTMMVITTIAMRKEKRQWAKQES
jgi:hypothetical protein